MTVSGLMSPLLFAVATTLALPQVAMAAAKTFGSKITLKTVTPLSEALSSFERYKDLEVLTTGTVAKVCEKKGCWMTVKTDASDVRVTFKDYAFFVPASIAGKTARLQGYLTKQEVSVADQKHLLQDAGASAAEIEAVKAPKAEFSFVASGVEL